MVVGTAERVLLTRHRAIMDAVRRVIGPNQPLAPSGSAFRLAYDQSAERDQVDASAVAADLDVLYRAIDEQPLRVPLLNEITLEQRSGRRRRPRPTGRSRVVAKSPATAVQTAIGSLATVVSRAESMLMVPSRVVGCDRAELACRAHANGWFEEAEGLFLQATDRLPTEPYLWFAAGLSAAHLSVERAVAHLARSARYLASGDPAAAVYVNLLAAALLEADGDRGGAVGLLQSTLDDLGQPCPVLSLHLARLAPESVGYLRTALEVDPLLEADLVALDLDRGPEALAERRRLLERELGWLDFSMAEMRGVDEGPAWVDPRPELGSPVEPDSLPLTRLEVELWARLKRCEHEIRLARGAVSGRAEARVTKEKEISQATIVAARDLDYRAAVPVLVAAIAIAVGLGLSFLVPDSFGPLPSLASSTIVVWTAVGRIGMVVFFFWLVVMVAWPRRHFARARRAKAVMPRLEWQAASLRQSEFEARRRFNQANQAAELRIRRIVDRRQQLIPRRPAFPALETALQEANDGDLRPLRPRGES